jgi:hypothetical protein
MNNLLKKIRFCKISDFLKISQLIKRIELEAGC